MVEIGCEPFEKDKECDAEDWIIMNVYSIFQLYCEGEKHGIMKIQQHALCGITQ